MPSNDATPDKSEACSAVGSNVPKKYFPESDALLKLFPPGSKNPSEAALSVAAKKP
jgi:hypothetical protein